MRLHWFTAIAVLFALLTFGVSFGVDGSAEEPAVVDTAEFTQLQLLKQILSRLDELETRLAEDACQNDESRIRFESCSLANEGIQFFFGGDSQFLNSLEPYASPKREFALPLNRSPRRVHADPSFDAVPWTDPITRTNVELGESWNASGGAEPLRTS